MAAADGWVVKAERPIKPEDALWAKETAAKAAPKPAPKAAAKPAAKVNPVTGFLTTMNAAIPGADEFADLAGALTTQKGGFSDRWQAQRAQSKGQRQGFQAEHPHVAAAAMGTGYAIPALFSGGAGAIGGGEGLLAGFGRMAAPRAGAAGEGILGGLTRRTMNLGRDAVVGAGSAALEGVMGEGSIPKRLADAGKAVGPGALFGALAPVPLKVGKAIGNKVAEVTAPAQQKAAVKASNILRNQIPDMLRPTAAEPGNLPFETMGRGAATTARAVASVPGPGQDAANAAFRARRQGAVPRMQAATEQALGGSGADFHPTKQMTQASRAERASPHYQAAEDTPINATDFEAALGPILRTDQGQKALASARRIAQGDEALGGGRVDPVMLGEEGQSASGWVQNYMNPNGGVSGVEVPNSTVLDYISQGWDEVLHPYRNPHSGRLELDKMSPEAKAVLRMRNAYVERLGQLVPENAAARQSWADESQMLDALEHGRKVVGSNMDPEAIAARSANMRPEDMQAQRLGMSRGVADKLLGPNPRAFYRSMEQNPRAMERLQAGFGDDEAFGAFQEAGQREARHEQSYADVMRGSRTTPLREDIDATNAAAGNAPIDGALEAVGEALVRKAGGQSFKRTAANRMVNYLRNVHQPALRDPQVSEMLGDVLFNGRDPQEILSQAARRQVISQDTALQLWPIFRTAAGFSVGDTQMAPEAPMPGAEPEAAPEPAPAGDNEWVVQGETPMPGPGIEVDVGRSTSPEHLAWRRAQGLE